MKYSYNLLNCIICKSLIIWNKRCKELEEDNKKGHTRALFTQLKRMRTPYTGRQGTVKGANGEVLHDQQSVKNRWKEYTEDLYANPSQQVQQHPCTDIEPDILEEEVEWAIRQLPNRKAPGIDGIPSEMLKAVPIPVLTALCQAIWKGGKWPKDWKRSVFILIPKKGDTSNCSNYRTTTLISHASKILLKIIQQRLGKFIEAELPDTQAGFRKGRGTRDHIANLRWIMETRREYQKDTYMCFIDYSKAFDCVEHDKLWTALDVLGIPLHLIMLIQLEEATVYTTYGNTEWFKIGKGVRQGCILSPLLFNLYAETIMRKLDLDESIIWVKIGGRNINNLRYADDTTLLAESVQDLEDLILRVKEEKRTYGPVFECQENEDHDNSEQRASPHCDWRWGNRGSQRFYLPGINYWAGRRLHIWNQAEDCIGSWRNGEHDQDLEKQRS